MGAMSFPPIDDAGHAAANTSHLGFGSAGGIESAGALSPHPPMLGSAPMVRGEEVRSLGLLGLHGAEMRNMSRMRFDRSDAAGTGRSGAAGNAPPSYTPTPGDGGGGIGGGGGAGALPFTMPGMGPMARDQAAGARPPRAPRGDVTDVVASLPRMKARRGNKPTGI